MFAFCACRAKEPINHALVKRILITFILCLLVTLPIGSAKVDKPCYKVFSLGLQLFFLSDFKRPLFFRASAMIHCSCPFVLLNSSAAHFSSAFMVSVSTLSTKLLIEDSFFATFPPYLLMIQRTGIHNRLSRFIGTKHHQQIAYHGRLLLFVELHNLIGR